MHNMLLFYSFQFDSVNNENKWEKEYCVKERINKRASLNDAYEKFLRTRNLLVQLGN